LIKFSIHPSFFFIFFLALFHGFLYDVILLFVIVIIHELGHACTALSYGWRVRRIELLPFGGVAEMDEHGNRPIKEEALVIIAGPLMNVIMIGMTYFCLYTGLWSTAFAYQFLEYNLMILLFNLIPIWPLDGGKALQLLLCLSLPYKKAIKTSLLLSSICFLIYVFAIISFFPYYFSLWIVALFLLISQWLELKQTHFQYMRFLIDRHQNRVKKKKEVEVVSLVIQPNQLVKEALELMFRHKSHYFCLINKKGELQHVISEQELLEVYFTNKNAYRAVNDVFG
jgi:stage IV sporulation protein FB